MKGRHAKHISFISRFACEARNNEENETTAHKHILLYGQVMSRVYVRCAKVQKFNNMVQKIMSQIKYHSQPVYSDHSRSWAYLSVHVLR